MYQADSNNSKKQIPAGRPVSSYGRAETPHMKTFTTRPNHVIINKEGIYAFSYVNSGSVGGVHDDVLSYETGSVLDDVAGPVRIDINPIAWRRVDGTGSDGDVTFVYTGDIG